MKHNLERSVLARREFTLVSRSFKSILGPSFHVKTRDILCLHRSRISKFHLHSQSSRHHPQQNQKHIYCGAQIFRQGRFHLPARWPQNQSQWPVQHRADVGPLFNHEVRPSRSLTFSCSCARRTIHKTTSKIHSSISEESNLLFFHTLQKIASRTSVENMANSLSRTTEGSPRLWRPQFSSYKTSYHPIHQP